MASPSPQSSAGFPPPKKPTDHHLPNPSPEPEPPAPNPNRSVSSGAGAASGSTCFFSPSEYMDNKCIASLRRPARCGTPGTVCLPPLKKCVAEGWFAGGKRLEAWRDISRHIRDVRSKQGLAQEVTSNQEVLIPTVEARCGITRLNVLNRPTPAALRPRHTPPVLASIPLAESSPRSQLSPHGREGWALTRPGREAPGLPGYWVGSDSSQGTGVIYTVHRDLPGYWSYSLPGY